MIDKQVEWIADIIKDEMDRESGEDKGIRGKPTVEAKQDAEDAWIQLCYKLAEGTLFTETNNWIFATNIPDKRYKMALTFYFGGFKAYLDKLAEEKGEGYPGFDHRKPIAAS